MGNNMDNLTNLVIVLNGHGSWVMHNVLPEPLNDGTEVKIEETTNRNLMCAETH